MAGKTGNKKMNGTSDSNRNPRGGRHRTGRAARGNQETAPRRGAGQLALAGHCRFDRAAVRHG